MHGTTADDTDEDGTHRTQKELRQEYSSGWLVLVQNRSVAHVVDALLDLPPHREFNQSELADAAGVSRQSVGRHLDLLLELEIVEAVENTRPQRYRFDPSSDVNQAIMQLEGAINRAGR